MMNANYIEQHALAQYEARSRIKSAAIRMVSVELKTTPVITIGIQVSQYENSLTCLSQFMPYLHQLTNDLVTTNKDYGIISDELYEMITTNFTNRDIKVSIKDSNQGGYEVYYNNTQNKYLRSI